MDEGHTGAVSITSMYEYGCMLGGEAGEGGINA